MVDRSVVVRFIARGANQVGAQALKAAKSTSKANAMMAASAERAAARQRAVASAAALTGKAILFGVGAAFAVAAAAAIDFESSMAGVEKTLSGNFSQNQIDELGESLRALSLITPVNVNQLAGIAEIGGQLGVPIDSMLEFTEVVAAMGVSTNLSFEDAAKGLARFSNIMEIPITEAETLGNIIVELGNSFATSESEILNFATRLAPIGATTEMTADEVLGLAAAFSQLGIPAERGSTAIQRTVLDIEKSVETASPKLEKFADAAGMTVDEFSRLGATDRFVAFIQGLRDVQEEGGSAFEVLDNLNISQQRTISTLLAAAAAGDQFTSALAVANREAEDGNALFEEAARRYGTTSSQIQLMVNSFNDLRIEIGESLIDVIGNMLNFFRDLFQVIKNNLPILKAFGVALGIALGGKVLAGIAMGFMNAAAALRTFIGNIIEAKLVGSKAGLFGGGGASFITGALGGLTAAIQVATIALGAFFAWQARNEAKARELEASVKAVNDALLAGSDPINVWLGQINENLSLDTLDLISRMGISMNQLRQMVMGQGDTPLSGMIDDLARAKEALEIFDGSAKGVAAAIDRYGFDKVMEMFREGGAPARIFSADLD
jgi:TP901 family phage tail tape measure protein